MSVHPADDLPQLFTGEAGQRELLSIAEHLRRCPDCGQELVAAAVAHASLSLARRHFPELFARPASAGTDRIVESDLRASAANPTQPPAPGRGPARSRRHRAGLLVAAAVAVLVGGGATIAETVGSSDHGSRVAQSITLAPVGAAQGSATAVIANGTLRIDAGGLPRLAARRQYEVWLSDIVGQRMRPLGFIGTDRMANLPLPRSVMSRYGVVAISIQQPSQVSFSGDLIASGSYA
jgi:hypothetical protein